jgi:hypothetical protein
MAGRGGDLDLGREGAEISNKDARLGSVLQRITDAVNRLAINTASSCVGEIKAPTTPNAVKIKVSSTGEMVDLAISHNDPNLQRGVRYFTECSTSPSFSNAQGTVKVIDHGSSRSPHPFPLPTYQDDGKTKNNWHFRSYAQYPGSPPSEPVTLGGVGSPTAFQMNGPTTMTPQQGTGSGTGPNTGFSLGQGMGKTQTRQGK